MMNAHTSSSPMKDRLSKIRAILFDKDGTLVDFASMWGPMLLYAIQKIGASCPPSKVQSLGLTIGIAEDGSMIPGDSVIALGTQHDLARALLSDREYRGIIEDFLEGAKNEEDQVLRLASAVSHYATEYRSVSIQSCRKDGSETIKEREFPWIPFARVDFAGGLARETVVETLEALGMKYPLGVASMDTTDAVREDLEALELAHLFVFAEGVSIPSDKPSTGFASQKDGESSKHANKKHLLEAFARQLNVQCDEVMVVGDSRADAEMAHSGGSPFIGVLTGVGDANLLRPLGEAVIPNITDLPQLLPLSPS
eukprot:TRINITY_DN362_c3_g1_i2.p1 TRINITY_DN362_c3_g1~~TRINITY_DN362_c3_g1_i2.p1  ORF type:complete len:311 (-),score=110.55 TRINITY_DN362_c3_g1_i2:266-1198(-)